MKPRVEAFFDPRTSTVTFVAIDPATKDAVVIDPVLDYDPAAGTTSTESVDRVLAHDAFAGFRSYEERQLRTPIARQRAVLADMGAPLTERSLGTDAPRRGPMTR